MYGTGGRIGLAVLDSDLTIEADLRRLLPEDVEIHAARVIYPHSVSAENMAIATSGLETAIESLLPVRPAAIAWACTSGSFYGGRSGHERLVETMRRKAGGVPVFTAAGSVVDALKALGCRRAAVATPYSEDINRRLDRFLADHGIAAEPTIGYYAGTVEDYALQSVAEADLEAFLLKLDRPDCDALVMSCTGMPTARVAPRVEARLGKPVITSNLAVLWNAFRLGGIASLPTADYSLFRQLASARRAA
ncbi:MAG: aspartate/glutamate racemase family protein [Dongiaceae bacterium]